MIMKIMKIFNNLFNSHIIYFSKSSLKLYFDTYKLFITMSDPFDQN